MKKINWADQILNFVGIIIGVSLAFWINSAAQRSQEKKELKLIIESFIRELEYDIGVYEKSTIPDNEAQLLVIDSLINLMQTKELKSLDNFKRAFRYKNYYPQCVTFNSITNSGKLDLIKDFEVRKQINIYHEILATEAQWKGTSQVEFNKDNIQPVFINELDFINPEMSKIPKVKVQNLLFLYYALIHEKVGHYKLLVREGKKLKESLSDIQ